MREKERDKALALSVLFLCLFFFCLFVLFNLADIKPPVEGSMAHTGLLSLGSLVLRIMAQP